MQARAFELEGRQAVGPAALPRVSKRLGMVLAQAVAWRSPNGPLCRSASIRLRKDAYGDRCYLAALALGERGRGPLIGCVSPLKVINPRRSATSLAGGARSMMPLNLNYQPASRRLGRFGGVPQRLSSTLRSSRS